MKPQNGKKQDVSWQDIVVTLVEDRRVFALISKSPRLKVTISQTSFSASSEASIARYTGMGATMFLDESNLFEAPK
jgi:hypothetical protein|tara:strand:- start:141 stop:368 length:228 start_codon:yes stop_codon:yes gene_type:complete